MPTSEEPRIYVVVAAEVTGASGPVAQPPGRQVAQACHAVSLMRVKRAMDMPLAKIKGKVDISPAIEPITTIVLQARDGKELLHLMFLMDKEEIPYEVFRDTNSEYGDERHEVPTAFATYPLEPSAIMGILDYLPLWGSRGIVSVG
jgi:hypothetical protein